MREHQARLLRAYLEAGKTVFIATPRGNITAWQKFEYVVFVEFLPLKVLGTKPDCVILDDYGPTVS